MTGPGDTTIPAPSLDPQRKALADKWEQLVRQGVPKEQATAQIQAEWEQIQAVQRMQGRMQAPSDATADVPNAEHPAARTRPEIAFGANAVNQLGLGIPGAIAPQSIKADMARMQQEHPIASAAGGIVGGVASPLNAAAGAAAKATQLPRLGRAAVQGALIGGASGAANAPEGERLKGAAIGTAVGGAAAPAVDLAANWAAPGIRRAAGKVGLLPAEPTVAGTQTQLAAEQSAQANQAYDAVRNGGLTVKNPEVLATFRDFPQFREAWEAGQEMARLDPRYQGPPIPDLPPELPEEFAKDPKLLAAYQARYGDGELPVAGIEYAKAALDDKIAQGFNDGTRVGQKTAGALNARMQKMLGLVDQEVPAYGTARGGFAQHQQVIDALGNPTNGGQVTPGFSHSPKYMAGRAIAQAFQTDAPPEAAQAIHAITPEKVPLVNPALLKQAQRAAPLPFTAGQTSPWLQPSVTGAMGTTPSLLAQLAERRANDTTASAVPAGSNSPTAP